MPLEYREVPVIGDQRNPLFSARHREQDVVHERACGVRIHEAILGDEIHEDTATLLEHGGPGGKHAITALKGGEDVGLELSNLRAQ